MREILTELLYILTLLRLETVTAARLEQRTQSLTIVLHGSVAEVAPFFGPLREAKWAPGWAPRFLHPPEGTQREGAVFTTTTNNGKERLWLLTAYDVREGRVEYVIIMPGFTANKVKIRGVPDGDGRCKATVTYRHSALTPEANDEVDMLDAHWAEQQRIHWERAINAALAKGAAHD